MTSPAAILDAERAKRERMLVTPEGLALPLTVATKGARVGALIIDFIVIATAMLVVSLVLGLLGINLIGQIEGNDGEVPGALEFILVIFILFVFFLRNGYFLYFELGPRGATPGKRMSGIRIASRDGGRLTAEAVIARNLLRDIEIFLPLVFIFGMEDGGWTGIAAAAWFALFMGFPFFNRDNLRAGDVIAGTWVVEAQKTRLGEVLAVGEGARGRSRLSGATYDFGEAELSVYGEYELKVLEQVLREDRPEAIAQVQETICRKIGWHPGAGDERAFLEAFYAQLRAKLEGDMRFGRRKADKYSSTR
ncbi:RDD family protein [Altererythrobacter sp. CAU 1778]